MDGAVGGEDHDRDGGEGHACAGGVAGRRRIRGREEGKVGDCRHANSPTFIYSSVAMDG